MKITFKLPDRGGWTWRDEAMTRLCTFVNLTGLALLALRSDSTMFAVVMMNGCREASDGLIAVTLRDGTLVDPSGVSSGSVDGQDKAKGTGQ